MTLFRKTFRAFATFRVLVASLIAIYTGARAQNGVPVTPASASSPGTTPTWKHQRTHHQDEQTLQADHIRIVFGKLAEANRLTQDILDLEVQEQTAHGNVWKKRGALLKRVQNVLRETETEVSAIV